MLNTTVRAAAEGMPADDPIIAAIKACRDGNAAFCAIKEADWPAHGGETAVVDKTYGPPFEALVDWDQPALTREGALTALRYALEENHDVDYSVPSMLAAALAYFEAETSNSEIEDLYRQWLDCVAEDATKRTAEEIAAMAEGEQEAINERYQDLQEKITAMTPTTARELAISLLVEKDGGGSDTRPEYNERVQRLANGTGWI